MRVNDAEDFWEQHPEEEPLFGGPARSTPGLSGAFAHSPNPPENPVVRVVAGMIWQHQGRDNPISIDELSHAVGRDDRTIKGVVEDLIMQHGMLIGGRRGVKPEKAEGVVRQAPEMGAPAGYYIIRDAEDLKVACGPYEAQAESMMTRARRLRSMAAQRGIA
jgi:hypothetical protein